MSGARKAAVLLAGLEATTAAELLRSLDAETIPEIVAELAYVMRYGDGAGAAQATHIQEFMDLLRGSKNEATDSGEFVQNVLRQSVGEDRYQAVLTDANQKLKLKDPFGDICSASVRDLSAALDGESAQVIAVVLSELPASKAPELLAQLEEDVRPGVVQAMAGAQAPLPEAKLRIALLIEQRLQSAQKPSPDGRPAAAPDDDLQSKQLRKTAVLLRTMEADIRGELLAKLTEQDKETATQVQSYMVMWEDVSTIADRAMQDALQVMAPNALAMALADADEAVLAKVQANISERARGMLEEEQSFMSDPKPEEIEQARESILGPLREMMSQGELEFE